MQGFKGNCLEIGHFFDGDNFVLEQYVLFQAKTASDSERYITCWLCEWYGRPKCTGLIGKAEDIVGDATKGLRWACPDCWKKDIDYYCLHRRNCVFWRLRSCYRQWWANLSNAMKYLRLLSFQQVKQCLTRTVACGPFLTGSDRHPQFGIWSFPGIRVCWCSVCWPAICRFTSFGVAQCSHGSQWSGFISWFGPTHG